VISASIASAVTTTTDIICNVLKILGTSEVRFYSRRVSSQRVFRKKHVLGLDPGMDRFCGQNTRKLTAFASGMALIVT
jgi:hypothetical protein